MSLLHMLTHGQELRPEDFEFYDITCVAFSPDGAALASGSYLDKAVVLTDPRSGEVLKRLQHHTMTVRCVTFSPDGTVLASGSNDKTVVLSDARSGEVLHKLKNHTWEVTCVAFSPNGTVLASGSKDRRVVLTVPRSGEAFYVPRHHTDAVNSVAFSPDGVVLASGSEDKTVVLVDPRSGRLLRTLKHHTHCVTSVAFSPDGTMLATGSFDSRVVLTDPRSGDVLRTLKASHASEVCCVAFSPDGAVIASGSEDKTVVLTDPRSGTVLHTLRRNGRVFCVAFSPDGAVLASGSRDKTVVLERNKVFDEAQAQVAAVVNDNPRQLVKKAKAWGHLERTAVSVLCTRQRAHVAAATADLSPGKPPSSMQPWIEALNTLPSGCIDAEAIAAQLKHSLSAEYERAVASGAVGAAEAALILRAHVEAVLCLPLQESVDAALNKPKASDALSVLTAKLQDPSWWYTRAVIAPMQDEYADKLLEEVRLADLDALRVVAEKRLDADLKIYSAIHDKEKLKPEYSELAAEVAKLEADVRARCKRKPRQPGLEPIDAHLTVAQVKAQAADAHFAYRKVVMEVAAAAGVTKDGVKIPAMKGAYRMLQKAVRTAKAASGEIAIGDCRSICDVNRALLTAESPAHARKIVAEIVKHPRVEIKWMKDRINHPTDGGWCDVLILFSIEGTNGHVNEVQVAFKNMISQRTAGESHKAYAQARDAIETIEAAGSAFVKQANTDSAKLLEDVRRLTQQNRELQERVKALSVKDKFHADENRALKDEVERLQRELDALRGGADGSS